MAEERQVLGDEVATEGGKAYIIPGGGSNAIGSTGYVVCAQEILEQMREMELEFSQIVCASGSSGTHAGLVTGIIGNHSDIPIIGISVSRKKGPQEDLVHGLVQKVSKHVGATVDISKDKINVFDEYVCPA